MNMNAPLWAHYQIMHELLKTSFFQLSIRSQMISLHRKLVRSQHEIQFEVSERSTSSTSASRRASYLKSFEDYSCSSSQHKKQTS